MRWPQLRLCAITLLVFSALNVPKMAMAATSFGVVGAPDPKGPALVEQDVPNVEIGPMEYHPSRDSKSQKATMSDLMIAVSRLGLSDRHALGPLSPDEYAKLASNLNGSSAGERLDRFKVGIVRKPKDSVSLAGALPALARGGKQSVTGGLLERDMDGRLGWTASFSSGGAEGLRLCLTDISLPPGSRAFVYDVQGEVHGPYTFDANSVTPAFWTNTVFSSEIILEVQFGSEPQPTPSGIHIAVTSVLHVQHNFPLPQNSGIRPASQLSETCFVNETCVVASEFANIGLLSRAVAELSFVEGGFAYLCTGALLNDVPGDGIPYLLTANHCFDTQAAASSLEAYFQYTTASCFASFPSRSTAPRTLGASLLATSTASDFSFVRLSQPPPAGSVYLGWTTSDYSSAGGVSVYRVSHPNGWPQFYSRHSISAVPSPGQCAGRPQGSYIYSKNLVGGTAGGSSGSPLCLPDGKVVGQLLGSCGNDLDDNCDSVGNSELDGAFRTSYSAMAQWLSPSGVNGVKANFSFSPSTAAIGQPVSFVDASTGGPTTWYWSFGDGFSSASQNASHAFTSAGAVGVTLTATNGSGSDQITKTFTVTGSQPTCVGTATTVCLGGGRFRVKVDWRVPSQGTSGVGSAVALTADTGYFWFFSASNVELVIKVVDGRSINNHFWVFYGALSDVGYTITVTDTQSGTVQTYTNIQGRLTSFADLNAF